MSSLSREATLEGPITKAHIPIRVGIVFVFQHQLYRLLAWKEPTHTLSFLAVYSFVCLDPQLLAILPVVMVLLFIMVPAFIARHPPPPASISGKIEPYTAHGGAIAPPPEVKAVSEMSKVSGPAISSF